MSKVEIIRCFSEIMFSEGKDNVKELRLSALKTLNTQINYYRELGIREDMLTAIAEKKCKFIMQITSKTEMEKMLKPHCPPYNGNEFVPDIYNVPEEEMICWSETSMKAPLNEAGFKRYMQLFESIFPKEYNEFLGTGVA